MYRVCCGLKRDSVSFLARAALVTYLRVCKVDFADDCMGVKKNDVHWFETS